MLLYFPKIFLEICQNHHALSVRMREAKRLMMEDRLSIKEVAARTGFSSQAYFCYAYRAFYGHPPSRDHAYAPAAEFRVNTACFRTQVSS